MGLNKGINRFIKVYPLYHGFIADLLFYIAIDTLFLTVVKNFTAAQIVSITAISQLVCILLQFPILFVMKKIGNTASVRIGAFCILISSIFITFGKSYYLVLFGRILHEVDIIFRNASIVTLENNLEIVGRRGEFVRLRTSANTAYSFIKMIIAFIASYMFNLNNYLPMIGCITTCTVGFILSFFIKDYSEYNKISRKSKKNKVKITYSKVIVLTLFLYAVFYSVVNSGQTDGKLFIQQHSLLDFSIETTALIIGAIVCVSRIVRVISNIVFARLYERYQVKMGFALPTLLSISMCFMLFGSFIPQVVVKLTVMSIGYAIILFIRDPFNLYVQDVLFDSTPKEQHQTLLVLLTFGTKVASAGLGLVFSAILVSFPMVVVIAILLAISVIEIIVSMILYRAIMIGRQQKSPSEEII